MPVIRILLLGLAALPAVAAPSGRSAPLVFVRNYGQARPEARFLAKTPRFNAYFERRETVLEMRGAALRIGFIDAEAAEPEAEPPKPGKPTS